MSPRFERLVVASKNPDKIAEVEAVLGELGVAGEVVRGLEWPDIEETEETLEGNAVLKARTVCSHTGLPAVADDTGLEVEALGGAPGVHSARFAGPDASYADNVEKLLSMLAGVENRRARFRTVIALADPGGRVWTADGSVEGRIVDTPRGSSGFGYDPVFEVKGRTMGEMSIEEKNRLSHRARALRALAQKLV